MRLTLGCCHPTDIHHSIDHLLPKLHQNLKKCSTGVKTCILWVDDHINCLEQPGNIVGMLNTPSLLILPILLQTCCKHSLLNRPNDWTIIAIIHSQKMKMQIWRKYQKIRNGDEDIWRSWLSSRLLPHYQYQIAGLSKLRRIFSNFRKKRKMQSSTI